MTSEKTNKEAGKCNVVGFSNNCNNNNKSYAQKITKINGNEIEFEIDTGACVSVVSKSILDKNFDNCKVVKYNCQMKLISGETLDIFGKIRVDATVNDKIYDLELTVLNSFENFVPLLGRRWLDILFPTWRNFFSSFN